MPQKPKALTAVADRCCALCRYLGLADDSPAEIHHLRTDTGMGRRSERVLPLCVAHHRTGNESLHGLGRKAWERKHGVSKLELWEWDNR